MADAMNEVAGVATLPPELSAILADRGAQETWKMPGEPDALPLIDKTSTDRSMVTVYSTLTGDPHPILRIDLPRAIRTLRPDGKPAFWAPGMPGDQPKRNVGTLKCFLHPESAERELVDSAGYTGRFCNDGDPSKNNRDDFQAISHKEDHEKRKHPGAWAAVERARRDARDADVRALAQAQLDTQLAMAEAMKLMAAAQAPKTSTRKAE